MLLYHYAKTPFESLKTRRVRGGITVKELEEADRSAKWRRNPGSYHDHLSFFLERAPLDILGTVFQDVPHEFWVAGATIYEHVVDSRLIGDFKYQIVESPLDMTWWNHWREEWDMDPKWDDAKEKFYDDRAKAKVAVGEIGSGDVEFERVARKLTGHIRADFIHAAKILDREDRLKYAAGVPHVMLYPTHGELMLVGKAKRVRVGPKDLRLGLEAYPTSGQW